MNLARVGPTTPTRAGRLANAWVDPSDALCQRQGAWHLYRPTALGTAGVAPALPVQGLTSWRGPSPPGAEQTHPGLPLG
jgi:hypothetical protein